MLTRSRKSRAGKVLIHLLFLAGLAAGIAFDATVVRGQQADKDKEAIRRRKIKSVTGFVYSYQSGVASLKGRKQFVRRYDQNGNMTEFTGYGSRGEELQTETYRYDAANRLVSATFGDALHWNDGSQTYSYNSAGQLIASEVRKPDQTVTGRYTYAYNTAGKLVKSVSYKGTGEVLSNKSYRYDTAGNLIEYSAVNGNGQLQEKISHQYDGAGKAVSSTGYDSAGGVIYRTTYKYDARQKIIETMIYLPNGSLSSGTTYRYDGNYDLLEQTDLNSQKQPVQLTKFVYEFYG